MEGLLKKTLKNHMFLGTSIWKGFGVGFGRFLAAQNVRFSHLFNVFLKPNLSCVSDRLKIEKKAVRQRPSGDFGLILAAVCGMCGLRGEKKRGVQEPLQIKAYRKNLEVSRIRQHF